MNENSCNLLIKKKLLMPSNEVISNSPMDALEKDMLILVNLLKGEESIINTFRNELERVMSTYCKFFKIKSFGIVNKEDVIFSLFIYTCRKISLKYHVCDSDLFNKYLRLARINVLEVCHRKDQGNGMHYVITKKWIDFECLEMAILTHPKVDWGLKSLLTNF